MTGAYGRAASDLYAAGWRGVLQLPAGQKAPPPTGTTGAGGTWPSGADVWATAEDHPDANVGIRLPPTVIGFDVDNYGGKAGAATWSTASQRHGDLPPTWTITSRTDGVSGIRLFTVPPGLHWPGELGAGVEIIQTRHRYCVAPPSIHPEGRPYRWVGPDGATSAMPSPDDLPLLPDGWVSALSGGRLAADLAKVQPGNAETVDWYTSERNNRSPCGRVRTATARAVTALRGGTASRHDAGLRAVMSLAYLAAEGHEGVMQALVDVNAAWYTAVTTGSSAREPESAHREWQAIMSGALGILAADGQLAGNDVDDPCATPLAGLLEPRHDGAGDRLEPRSTTTAESVPVDPDAERAAFDADVARSLRHMRVTAEARTQHTAEQAARSWTPPVGFASLVDELALPDEPVAWLVDEIMPTGSNTLVTAQFKAGKTTLVNDLVRCLVDGVPFLDRYATHLEGGRVGIWNYEVGREQYRRWLRDLSIRNPEQVSLLNLRGSTMPMKVEHVQAWIVSWLIEHKITVWVVDPLARAFLGSGQSENDNTEMGSFLETLDVIKERAGVSELVLPTHTGRAAQESGTERSRGATRVDDWADVRWILTRDAEGGRFFRASGRDVETDEGTLMHDPVMRTLTLIDGGREPAEKIVGGEGALYNAIMSACTANPGISARALREYVRNSGTKGGNEKILNATMLLVQQGRLERRGGTNGQPVTHFVAQQVDS